RVDDRPDAGILVERDVGEIEAEETVDLLLVQDALGAALVAGPLDELSAVLDHRRPLGGHVVAASLRRPHRGGAGVARLRQAAALRRRALLGERQAPFGCEIVLVFGHVGLFAARYWTTISLNSTALILLGATAMLTRRVSSSRMR